MTPHTIINCGWGRLLMGQTFASQRDLVEALIAETPQQRTSPSTPTTRMCWSRWPRNSCSWTPRTPSA